MKSYLFALVFVFAAATGGLVRAQSQGQAPVPGEHQVDGLALPANQTVSAADETLTLKAVCAGPVKFYIQSTVQLDEPIIKTHSIVLQLPPAGGQIMILAVGWAGGKFTEFANTKINVTPAQPKPTPEPAPPVAKVAGPLYVVLVYDAAQVTPAQATVLNSAKLREAVGEKFLKVVKRDDPWLTSHKLDAMLKTALPALLAQDDKGKVVLNQPLPATEAEALTLIQSLKGK